ncbi:MAG: A24 family peptidase [Gammaproteobacteria bacterium]
MTDFAGYLSGSPWTFTLLIALLGLLVGSFLNVVAYRLPLMMERAWRAQCRQLLDTPEAPSPSVEKAEPFNLMTPRSRCPHCGHAISAMENIPVISYLWLRGRCAACGKPISARYPLVESATALLSGVTAWHFGFGWAAGAALLLTWALIALTLIDYDHQLLPDDITLPFLWIGLLLSLYGIFTDSTSSIIGGVAGYLSLWTVYILFKWATGKEGMGYGDFKLLAMLGTWMGWQALPVIIILSSVVGAAVGITLIVFRGRDRNIPIPFGPYLATAGWLALLWGHDITHRYLSLVGVPS